jgi:intracellular sulfur oxidation DsrE/DsrF family protein
MMMLFIILCSTLLKAQTVPQETVKLIEVLQDGTFIVERNGQRYQAFSGDQVRELQRRQVTLVACQADVADANIAIDKLKMAVQLAQTQAALSDSQLQLQVSEAARYKTLWQGELELRKKADQLNEQANALIHRGKISTILDNPWIRLSEKFGTNVLQGWLSSRRRK